MDIGGTNVIIEIPRQNLDCLKRDYPIYPRSSGTRDDGVRGYLSYYTMLNWFWVVVGIITHDSWILLATLLN